MHYTGFFAIFALLAAVNGQSLTLDRVDNDDGVTFTSNTMSNYLSHTENFADGSTGNRIDSPSYTFTITSCNVVSFIAQLRNFFGTVTATSALISLNDTSLQTPRTPNVSTTANMTTGFEVVINPSAYYTPLTHMYQAIDNRNNSATPPIAITNNIFTITDCNVNRVEVFSQNQCNNVSQPLTLSLDTALQILPTPNNQLPRIANSSIVIDVDPIDFYQTLRYEYVPFMRGSIAPSARQNVTNNQITVNCNVGSVSIYSVNPCGDRSASIDVPIPADSLPVPNPPTEASIQIEANGQLLNWAAPTMGDPVISYEIEERNSSGALTTQSVSSSMTSVLLQNCLATSVFIFASSECGRSTNHTEQVTDPNAFPAPMAPIFMQTVANPQWVFISWIQSNNSMPVRNYTVNLIIGSAAQVTLRTLSATTRTLNVTALNVTSATFVANGFCGATSLPTTMPVFSISSRQIYLSTWLLITSFLVAFLQ